MTAAVADPETGENLGFVRAAEVGGTVNEPDGGSVRQIGQFDAVGVDLVVPVVSEVAVSVEMRTVLDVFPSVVTEKHELYGGIGSVEGVKTVGSVRDHRRYRLVHILGNDRVVLLDGHGLFCSIRYFILAEGGGAEHSGCDEREVGFSCHLCNGECYDMMASNCAASRAFVSLTLLSRSSLDVASQMKRR